MILYMVIYFVIDYHDFKREKISLGQQKKSHYLIANQRHLTDTTSIHRSHGNQLHREVQHGG